MLTSEEMFKIVNQIQTYQEFERFILDWIEHNEQGVTLPMLTILTTAISEKMSNIIQKKIHNLKPLIKRR